MQYFILLLLWDNGMDFRIKLLRTEKKQWYKLSRCCLKVSSGANKPVQSVCIFRVPQLNLFGYATLKR